MTRNQEGYYPRNKVCDIHGDEFCKQKRGGGHPYCGKCNDIFGVLVLLNVIMFSLIIYYR